jgi:hypothetical protein
MYALEICTHARTHARQKQLHEILTGVERSTNPELEPERVCSSRETIEANTHSNTFVLLGNVFLDFFQTVLHVLSVWKMTIAVDQLLVPLQLIAQPLQLGLLQ